MIDHILNRLDRIENLLIEMQQQRTTKEFYTTAEVAEIVSRSEYTVREWCRLGRVQADKSHVGCGGSMEWRISHDELQRVLNEGPLPIPKRIG